MLFESLSRSAAGFPSLSRRKSFAAFLFLVLSLSAMANASEWEVADEGSHLEIHVPKAGIFSFAGHEHTIVADRLSGSVSVNPEQAAPVAVSLEVPVAGLQVKDSDLDAEDREKVRATMVSARVLHEAAAPVIRFQSEQFEQGSSGGWQVSGALEVAGRPARLTFPLQITFPETGQISAEGEVEVRLADFGIEPVRALGGTIRTGKTVTVRFRVVATGPRP